MIPRIMGKIGQATEPEDIKGKWFFQIWLTTVGGGEGDSLGLFGPWESEGEAERELEKAVQLACEAIETEVDGKPSGKYIDMKTNELRSWDKFDVH